MLFTHKFVSTEFDCPGDGDCSNQGACDESSGTCVCDEGFEGDMCQGKKKLIHKFTKTNVKLNEKLFFFRNSMPWW